MKKRCLLAVLLVLVMLLTGCGGQPATEEVASEEASSVVDTMSSEGTDWYRLETDGAKLAEDYIKNSQLFALMLRTGADHYIEELGLIVVSRCQINKEKSTDSTYYWNVKGHFYGEDEYGHTDGVYDFDATVYNDGYPTSSSSFEFDPLSIVIKKSN